MQMWSLSVIRACRIFPWAIYLMASRSFSSSVRAAKALKWKLNGTTVPVDKYIAAVEAAVDALPPKFAAKAKVGFIQGNPHETPENNDPMHASGKIGEGNASGKKRLSSFHVYPNGSVIFSDPALKPFNKGPDNEATASDQLDGSLTIQKNNWRWDAHEEVATANGGPSSSTQPKVQLSDQQQAPDGNLHEGE